mgnify:CR=1 FL=1
MAGPFKMKGSPMQRNFGSPLTKKSKTTQAERDAMTPAQRLLAVVPNEEAFNNLSPSEQKSFTKAAKASGLPTKKVKKT